jgi:hypothetical protein
MTLRRSHTVGLLAAGLLLAVGTPIYLARVAPYLSGYLLNTAVLFGQAVPYLVCAALWLPHRSQAATKAGAAIAALLLLAALITYVPKLLAAEKTGGDMIGLAYILISAFTTAGVLIASAVAALLLRRQGSAG